LYVVYICQKSLNFTYAFKCYQQNCSWLHFTWTTLYTQSDKDVFHKDVQQRRVRLTLAGRKCTNSAAYRTERGAFIQVSLCISGSSTLGPAGTQAHQILPRPPP